MFSSTKTQILQLFYVCFSLPAINSLGLEWYPLPGVAWLLTEIGGLQFPATPFTGWFSSIEILRDLLEENRYPGVMQVNAEYFNRKKLYDHIYFIRNFVRRF